MSRAREQPVGDSTVTHMHVMNYTFVRIPWRRARARMRRSGGGNDVSLTTPLLTGKVIVRFLSPALFLEFVH